MKSIFLLLLANLSLQCGAVIAKSLFVTLGALEVSIARLSIAAVLLVVVQRPWRLPIRELNWRAIIGYGLSLAGMNVLFYQAISRIPMGIAVAIEFVGPLAIAIFQSRGWKNLIWILLATCGLLIFSVDALHASGLSSDSSSRPALDPLGLIFALISGVCWASYILTGKIASRRKTESIESANFSGITSLGMATGALFVLPLSTGISQISSAAHAHPVLIFGVAFGREFGFAIQLLGLAIFSSAIPYSLEMIALKSLSSASFGILMSLQPAVAGLVAFLVLREQLSGWQWLAISLIMAASIGVTRTSLPTETSELLTQTPE